MELSEAIEILTEDTHHPTADFMPKLKKAEQLGIEALTLLRDHRNVVYFRYDLPLPSETKD